MRRSIVLLSLFGLLFSGCAQQVQTQNQSGTSSQDTTGSTTEDLLDKITMPELATASHFGTYEEIPTDFTPQVEDYALAEDLSNVINPDDFFFSDDAKKLLVENNFVVTPMYENEFYPIYENNRYEYYPSFITSDSVLHNYHIMFDHLLKTLEEEKLSVTLEDLNAKMLAASEAQYDELEGTEWENAAARNVGFFAVGSSLLGTDVDVPDYIADEVSQELALVEGQEGITISPLMNYGLDLDITEANKEDYSQYIPRGHYTKSELLKNYFKSMMWYGRLTFRFKTDDEIRSAMLISLALDDKDSFADWETIYEPTSFLVGKSDDISYYSFMPLIEEVFGTDVTLDDVTGSDAASFDTFVQATSKLEPPQINSMPIFNSDINPDREKEIKGFRYMGQRFTVDASIFQRLIDRETVGRMLPKGLDILAAMGSDEAMNLLEEMGETKYSGYTDNMDKMQQYIAGLDEQTWTQNVYWTWMYSLLPLLEERGEGYPVFMQNLAWVRKDLQTYLGSWTELKHDTILYAKQVYAEMGGGPDEPDSKDDRGYVEPNPVLYARLAALTKMTSEGLEQRGLLSDSQKETLGILEEIVLQLKTISEKELNNETLTDAEYEFIRSYGGQLEHFYMEINKQALEESGMSASYFMQENPAALVADVATDPNGQVLEEAIGHVYTIYAVVPVDGELRIARGGVFSYFEFPWPINDRLTDEKWREMVNYGEAPAQPEWTNVFITE